MTSHAYSIPFVVATMFRYFGTTTASIFCNIFFPNNVAALNMHENTTQHKTRCPLLVWSRFKNSCSQISLTPPSQWRFSCIFQSLNQPQEHPRTLPHPLPSLAAENACAIFQKFSLFSQYRQHPCCLFSLFPKESIRAEEGKAGCPASFFCCISLPPDVTAFSLARL